MARRGTCDAGVDVAVQQGLDLLGADHLSQLQVEPRVELAQLSHQHRQHGAARRRHEAEAQVAARPLSGFARQVDDVCGTLQQMTRLR
jgi:hypothetical protein